MLEEHEVSCDYRHCLKLGALDMAKRKLLPKTKAPIEAVFLGIDSSKNKSGAVSLAPIYDDDSGAFTGEYERLMFNTVAHKEQSLRAEFVETAAEEAHELKVPLVIVAEDWTPGGKRVTFDTIKALGQGWGLWESEILTQVPEAVLIQYKPAEWRELAFTWRYPKGREAVKKFAMEHIKKVWGFEVGEDIAEAGCIALAGTHSGEVAEALTKIAPSKKRKKKVR